MWIDFSFLKFLNFEELTELQIVNYQKSEVREDEANVEYISVIYHLVILVLQLPVVILARFIF